MIGRRGEREEEAVERGIVETVLPEADTLYLISDLAQAEEWVQTGAVMRATLDGQLHYYYRPSLRKQPLAKRPKLKPTRALTLTPLQRQLVVLRKELDGLQDRQRKLKMLAKSDREHGNLSALIEKWRDVCQRALEEFRGALNGVSARQILAATGVSYENVGLDLGSDDADEDGGRRRSEWEDE